MYSNEHKNITKILICLIMFFSFNIGVKAAKNYTEQSGNTNLYSNCRQSNNCMPICIYTCESDSHKCYYAKEANNNEYAYYGHYYNNDKYEEEDNIKKVWSFGVLESSYIPILGPSATLYTWTNDKAPSEDGTFYYLNDTSTASLVEAESSNNLINWRTTQEYEKLTKSYVCPKYMGFNSKSSIFFTNDDAAISYRKLSYSFIDELETVIKNASSFSNSQQGTTPLQEMHEAYAFMSKAAGYDEYNNSLSEEQNNTKFCAFLKEKANNGIEQFVKDFSNDENLAKEIINERLSDSAVNHADSRFRYIYTYENLQVLLEEDKIVNSENVSYLKRINDIYSLSERNALSYFNNKCELGLSLDDMQNIQDQTSQTVMEKLQSTTHKLDPIDFDEEFDCDTLFGGEIANIISGAYFIIEMAALGILIVFTVIDYAKVILNGESDEIKKQNQKLMKRLIIVVVIFILPALVNTTLRLFHIEGFNSDHPLCVKISNK